MCSFETGDLPILLAYAKNVSKSSRKTRVPSCAPMGRKVSVDAWRKHWWPGLRGGAIDVDDGVERLVESHASARERSAQHALLHRADFPQRAVAAAVRHRGSRLETPHADHVEREVEHEPRALLEESRSPERRPDRESPF